MLFQVVVVRSKEVVELMVCRDHCNAPSYSNILHERPEDCVERKLSADRAPKWRNECTHNERIRSISGFDGILKSPRRGDKKENNTEKCEDIHHLT